LVRWAFGVSWSGWPIGYLVSQVQLDDLTQDAELVARIVRSGIFVRFVRSRMHIRSEMFVRFGMAGIGREEEARAG
jgi:hypothetical protein